jgi:hypothetical protein
MKRWVLVVVAAVAAGVVVLGSTATGVQARTFPVTVSGVSVVARTSGLVVSTRRVGGDRLRLTITHAPQKVVTQWKIKGTNMTFTRTLSTRKHMVRLILPEKAFRMKVRGKNGNRFVGGWVNTSLPPVGSTSDYNSGAGGSDDDPYDPNARIPWVSGMDVYVQTTEHPNHMGYPQARFTQPAVDAISAGHLCTLGDTGHVSYGPPEWEGQRVECREVWDVEYTYDDHGNIVGIGHRQHQWWQLLGR